MLAGPRGGKLCEVLEAMGKRSASAQGLRKPVTLGTPYQAGQRIYLLADARTALGILKVGTKRLFVAPPASAKQSDARENLVEINPVCALDFYVHESCQRGGFGRKLFDAMLQHEGLRPAKLAYDRPSSKFTGFLRKHFGLSSFTPQNNNFVVFDQFFKGEGERGASRDRSSLDGGRVGHGILPGSGTMGRSAALHDRPPPMPVQQPLHALQQQPLQLQPLQPQPLQPQPLQQQPPEHSGTLCRMQPPAVLPGSPLKQLPALESSMLGSGRPPLGGLPRDECRTSRSRLMPTPWGTDRDDGDFRGARRPTGTAGGRAPSADPPVLSVLPAAGGRAPRSNSLPASRGGLGSSSRFASPLSHAGQRMVRS